MKNRELLKNLALAVNDLLSAYIAVHDRRLKEAGSFISLFKKVNFKGIYQSVQILLDEFDEKKNQLGKFKKDFYSKFSEKEGEVFDCLEAYFNALHGAVKLLAVVAQLQLKKSENQQGLSFMDNQRYEKDYQEAIENYLAIGKRLSALYNELDLDSPAKLPDLDDHIPKEEAKQAQSPMKVAFIACEDEGQCNFVVEFKHNNNLLYFCKSDKFGVNVESVANYKCGYCKNLMELYQLEIEDNPCPICEKNMLAICYVRQQGQESQNKQLHSSKERAHNLLKALNNTSNLHIAFSHHSQRYIEEFNPKEDGRPTFFWFSDRYYDHVSTTYRDRFFYLFFANPKKDGITLRARHEGLGFNSLYSHYLKYKEDRDKNLQKGIYNSLSPEAPILMSFSTIIPDLILQFEDESSNSAVVIKPEGYKGLKITLFDNNNMPLKFTDTEIVQVLPKIRHSLPFVEPKKDKGEYIYEDWLPMVTEKMGMWI